MCHPANWLVFCRRDTLPTPSSTEKPIKLSQENEEWAVEVKNLCSIPFIFYIFDNEFIYGVQSLRLCQHSLTTTTAAAAVFIVNPIRSDTSVVWVGWDFRHLRTTNWSRSQQIEYFYSSKSTTRSPKTKENKRPKNGEEKTVWMRAASAASLCLS